MFSTIASQKPSVVNQFWSGPMSSSRSLVILPLSTVATQIFSRSSANLISAALPSSLPRCLRPPVQAKIDAIGLVEVALPCWRSEEHTSELQSLMLISYDVLRLKKTNITHQHLINSAST